MLGRLSLYPKLSKHIRQMKPHQLAPKPNRRDFSIRQHSVHGADGYHQVLRQRGPGQKAIFGSGWFSHNPLNFLCVTFRSFVATR